MRLSRIRMAATTALCLAVGLTAAANETQREILTTMRRTNDYFMTKYADPTKDTNVRGVVRTSNLWTRAVYYEGLMALYEIDPQKRYLDYTDTWGGYHQWTARYGSHDTDADNQCCQQVYIERHVQTGGRVDLSQVKENLDYQMNTGRVNYWTWIDAIQMAMPVYAKYARITGERKYLDYAVNSYKWTRDTLAGGLFNEKDGLWWRDKDYVPPYTERDGNNCYWSRGNGWVYAALVRVLQTLHKDDAYYRYLQKDYLLMSKALLKRQRRDGYWNVSLDSPTTYGGPETTGTGLFLYGMAWGVNNGLLDGKTYGKAMQKAWKALAAAVHEDGFIGYNQGTGKDPAAGQPVTYTSIPDFEDYGTGCLLLGAAEYYKLNAKDSRPTAQAVIDVDLSKQPPTSYSAELPDGNYKVTLTVGSKKKAAKTVVRTECQRLMLDEIATKKGEFKTFEFVVNKRSPQISDKLSVRLNPREAGTPSWDDRLTLWFYGDAPAVQRLRIEPDTAAVTLFLCGNSTVTDQPNDPYASWGQMIPRWFGAEVAVANHAESGLSAASFLASNRLEKILSQMKRGDYVFCEFGHNDQKEKAPGSGAWYNFAHNLKIFIDRVRQKGGTIVFVTPTQRRFFDRTRSKIQETHGEYPDAMRAVAKREAVPVIELHDMTRTFFEALGYEGSKKSLVHYPANTYSNQEKPLADNTHFNPYGAYEVAKMAVMGMKATDLPIVKFLRKDWKDFDPAKPDDPTKFVWYPSTDTDITKPLGN